MSYRIEYQYRCFRVPATRTGLDEDRFVICVEGGDNNLTNAQGRPVRTWEVCMIGTETEVLRQTVNFAGSCETGCLKPRGRDGTPEAYIRRVRKLIAEAREGTDQAEEGWAPRVRVPEGHAMLAELAEMGVETREEQSYGEPFRAAVFAEERLADFFRLVSAYCRPGKSAGWSFAHCFGLPRT